ncbi:MULTISPECIES: DM13 domain-containing protein [Pseudovibrio]|uniref:DM13 domain-containing protein n=1 Tax=Stappiaceae TaxID=2821832 RepID=UPI002366E501|nr:MULTISPECIES: DM13 domain-containing protein [Pseudovibrio]MDD7908944.1 DM13 domain-containing protein [Pseudovibrio exalbescens]MDX5593735.1 DM13 domain-containing protein [Pseudovibrio sp. SPO723]
MLRLFIGIVTHGAALGLGFALGVYFLPILTAPPSPDVAALQEMAEDALYTSEFEQDLRGHDFLHWGKGTVSLTRSQIVHTGELAPGPDYMVYLVPEFVAHEDEFLPLKDQSQVIGPVKTFQGFVLDIPEDVDIENYTTVLVWCEAFSEFIAAAKYK